MGLVICIAFVVALVLSVPISITLGVASMAGILYLSPDFLVIIPQKVLFGVNSFPLLAIPLFILAGTIMAQGGIARRIVAMALVFVGHIRGGLGLVVIVSTMLFSGVCGSASADTAAIGSITLPEMKKKGFPTPFATALLASAGGTSQLVPPSIDLIIIGVIGNISIGGLFAAGLLPGVVNGLGLMAVAYYFGWKLNLPVEARMSWKEKIWACLDGSLAALMAVIILGGILGGIFTPTEASAVAVVYGFCVSVFIYKELKFEDIPRVLLQTCRLTGMVMLVIGMAALLSFVLTFERIPHAVSQFIVDNAGNWIVFVLFVQIVLLLVGMVMDALPVLIILLPILLPVAVDLGMDPIHFGILVEANMGLSLITPPVGICLYVACGLSDLKVEDILRPLVPFILVLVATLLIISYVPEITLFVPRLLGYVQ
jgi:C4-dicarboxylate transporter DctM subunit